jgi:glycosyltransferase involved in cell wall biosynthesis
LFLLNHVLLKHALHRACCEAVNFSISKLKRTMTSTSGTPRASVLVTTYNQARYVEEALNSLRDQTSRDFEVIITDDASSDGTGDIIEAWLGRSGYSAQFIRNPENSGICANRNAALALSSGTFVCFLSGDDRFESTRIERQLEFFPARADSGRLQRHAGR